MRVEAKTGRGNGGGMGMGRYTLFSPNISLFCNIFLLSLPFFLIGRDISHGEENGEEVEKVKVRSLSHVRLCATP